VHCGAMGGRPLPVGRDLLGRVAAPGQGPEPPATSLPKTGSVCRPPPSRERSRSGRWNFGRTCTRTPTMRGGGRRGGRRGEVVWCWPDRSAALRSGHEYMTRLEAETAGPVTRVRFDGSCDLHVVCSWSWSGRAVCLLAPVFILSAMLC